MSVAEGQLAEWERLGTEGGGWPRTVVTAPIIGAVSALVEEVRRLRAPPAPIQDAEFREQCEALQMDAKTLDHRAEEVRARHPEVARVLAALAVALRERVRRLRAAAPVPEAGWLAVDRASGEAWVVRMVRRDEPSGEPIVAVQRHPDAYVAADAPLGVLRRQMEFLRPGTPADVGLRKALRFPRWEQRHD